MRRAFLKWTAAGFPLPALAGGAVFLVCLATLCPDVHVHDSGELIGSGWFLGISHPPGVPLYELLLKLFLTFIPVGNIALRANLFSALLLGAAAAAFVRLLLRFHLPPALAAAAGLAWAVTPTVWSQGTMAEVYPLAVLLLFLALDQLTVAFANDGVPRLGRFAFFWGLLLASHMAFSIATPIVWAVVAWVGAGRGAKGFALRLFSSMSLFARASGAFLAAFSLYLYLPLRAQQSPPFNWGDPSNLERFFFHLTNRAHQSRMFSLSLADYLGRGADYWGILTANLGGPLLPAVAVIAVVFLLFRPPLGPSQAGAGRTLVALLAILWATDAAFVVLLDTAPLGSEAYAIPSLAIILLLVALLVFWAFARLPWSSRLAPLALVLPIVFAIRFFAAADRSKDFIVRDEADAILSGPSTGATLFSRTDSRTFPIAYRQLVCRARTDLEIFDRDGNLFRRLAPVTAEIPAFERGAVLRRTQADETQRRLEAGKSVWTTDIEFDFAETSFRVEPAGVVHPILLSGVPRPAELCPHSKAPSVPAHPELVEGISYLRPRRGEDSDISRIDWMCREVLAATAEAQGDTAMACGDGSGARKAFERAALLSQQAANHYRLAQRWHRMNERDRAAREVERALHFDPAFVAAEVLGATLTREGGDVAGAEEHLRRAIARSPDLAVAHENLGVLLGSKADLEGAVVELRVAQRLEPSIGSTAFNLGLALRRLGRSAESTAEFRRAVALEPDNLHWRTLLAEALEAAGDRNAAGGILAEAPVPVIPGAIPSPEDLDRYCAAACRNGQEVACRRIAKRTLEERPGDQRYKDIAARAGV